jgi:hypothetical protein
MGSASNSPGCPRVGAHVARTHISIPINAAARAMADAGNVIHKNLFKSV